jgi:hypothetical protein
MVTGGLLSALFSLRSPRMGNPPVSQISAIRFKQLWKIFVFIAILNFVSGNLEYAAKVMVNCGYQFSHIVTCGF